MLSDTAEHALRAALYLANRDPEEPVPAAVVAEDLGLPRNYLSKILQRLARAGVLESSRGPTGGFRLAARPGEISLDRTIAPFYEFDVSEQCLLGDRRCTDRNPCVAHERWKTVVEEVRGFFEETTLAELLRDERDKRSDR